MRIRYLARCLGLACLVLVASGAHPAGAALLTVTSCADSGAGSLRQAIATANLDDTIAVPPCQTPAITLTVPLVIDKSLTLQGSGAARTIIDGNDVSRVLVVQGPAVVAIHDITLQRGFVSAGGGLGGGAGLEVLDATVTLADSVVRDNRATYGAGILNTGTLLLLRSTVAGNQTLAADDGGGIYTSGVLTVVNSTITDNRSGNVGGGIYAGGAVTLLSSTVSHNHAEDRGGAISVSSANVVVRNTVLGGNTATIGGPSCFPDNHTAVSGGHNLASDTSCALGASGDRNGQDPLLGPLQDNGGPTPTRLPGPGSPAIDAGEPVSCPGMDQRGIGRPQGAACDIGAAEVVPPAPAPPPTSHVLTITPPSGAYVPTQGFDLVLVLDAPGRSVVDGEARLDGNDVTGPLAACVIPGTLASGLQTFRCPGLTGGTLGPSTHTLVVSLTLSDTTAVSQSVTWEVLGP